MIQNNRILIVGAGITGITLAERIASIGCNVLIIDKRSHIGGNCYDLHNNSGILIHKYGPHIFHTNNKEVWQYLSDFTDWIPYEHRVLGNFKGMFLPIPFNLTGLHHFFSDKANSLEKKLFQYFNRDGRVSILHLLKTNDKDLKFLADFIYEKIFLHYSKKQWGVEPRQLDSSVLSRVPIVLSYDDKYFSDKYQGMPLKGYTYIFKKMINSNNIKLKLNTDFSKIIDKSQFDSIFYTGPIDEYFNYQYGKLDYRCFKLKFITLNKKSYQPAPVVNYPDVHHSYTRITEFKKLTQQEHARTTICYEYPGNSGYSGWPLLDSKNANILKKYQKDAQQLNNIYFVGRLAEFKYLDMDDAVANALSLFKKIAYEKK